jgi:protein SCO1/2
MKAETATVLLTPVTPKRFTVWRLILLLIPLVTACGLLWLRQVQVQHLRNRDLLSYGNVPEFELVNEKAQFFGSDQLKNKIWIADFIFTTCPGPCPIISTRMAEIQKPLRDTDVHFVSFSVDPDKDTAQVLRVYAEKLKADPARWDFLTGDRNTIYALIEKGFKLAVSDGKQEDVPVHSTRVALVDRNGTIRGYYDALEPDAITKLLADTNHLLREQPK